MRKVALTPEDKAIRERLQRRGVPVVDEAHDMAASKEWRRQAGYLGPVHRAAAALIRYEAKHGWWGDRRNKRK